MSRSERREDRNKVQGTGERERGCGRRREDVKNFANCSFLAVRNHSREKLTVSHATFNFPNNVQLD